MLDARTAALTVHLRVPVTPWTGSAIVEEVLHAATTAHGKPVTVEHCAVDWHISGTDVLTLRAGLDQVKQEASRKANWIADQGQQLSNGVLKPREDLYGEWDRCQRLLDCTDVVMASMDKESVDG